MVTVSIAKQAFTVLFAPYSSPLLTTDTYLVEKRAFTRSLSAPWLVVGAQVKRAFVIADNDTQVEYVEGIIYDIRENYLNDPYQSVLVTWVNQDADDKTWMYKLIQTDNLCSLWELEASDFVLIERIKAFTFPDALLRLNGVSVANKFKEVIDYLSRYV